MTESTTTTTATATSTTGVSITQSVRLQGWADSLRLPCFVHPYPSSLQSLLADVNEGSLCRPPIPFQSKHLPSLKRNPWFVLQRPPDRTRSGLLIVWSSEKCCIYVSGDTHNQNQNKNNHNQNSGRHGASARVALLRLRVDPQFMADPTQPTVFSATLSATSRKLWIEDTLIWKGRVLKPDETFSERWKRAVQWTEHYCISDPKALSGVELEMAPWKPLSALKPEGVWELMCETGRFLWMPGGGGGGSGSGWQQTQRPPPKAFIEHVTTEPPCTQAQAQTQAQTQTGPLIACASRDSVSGPEQWKLMAAGGELLGRALIRTLTLSETLRTVKGSTTLVVVEWNPTFKKWEMKHIVDNDKDKHNVSHIEKFHTE